jgi:pimeloyl-ACP methyl ester carboxylesterase
VTVVALLHSPLTTSAAWGRLGEELLLAGVDAVVQVEVDDDETPPYAQRYVASAARQIAAQVDQVQVPRTDPPVPIEPIDLTGQPVVLVGHSGAGPLLPQVAFARQAVGKPVAGYVLVDAGLPRPQSLRSRLDLMQLEDPEFAAQLREHLATGGCFPQWTARDLAEQIPDERACATLVASLRSRAQPFFTEELPLVHDWPDAPVAYLQLSAAYRQPAATSRRRGWTTLEIDLGHFGPITTPDVVAAAIVELLRSR